jgi:hypothetical protein
MSSPYASQDSFAFDLYDQPGQLEWTQREGADVTRENTVETDPFSQQQTQLQPVKLGFCQLADWDEDKEYDEDPPKFIHYSIEWKVTVNNRKVRLDTEQGMVLGPALCWRLLLRPKLEKFLDRMLAKNRPLKSDDTNIVISVNERGQDDLIKRFDDTNVNWSVIERQLVAWSELFRRGKKLTVKISFNYVENSQGSATSSRKADKRCSTTNRMLAERDTQLDIEASSGQPPIWSKVYELMRCQVPSCNLGPHCWRDPIGKKHYKLRTSHLTRLIGHVKEGYVLDTHDDVPEEVRQQLYAEQQGMERRQKPASASAANFPPINITNVLPAPSSQIPPALDMTSASIPINRLDFPRPRDKAVEDYCAWQESQVRHPDQKAAYQKACEVMMKNCMSLELIYRDANPEFLIHGGVATGVALHIVGDIEDWVKMCKQNETEE